jgi:phosphoheptose isomerase
MIVRSNAHVSELIDALSTMDCAHLERWGGLLASMFSSGGKLLVAGNGGSAAQAQHLSAELVGRFGRNRSPLSALALHAETSTVTAVANDYGFNEVYARQVRAHGRDGDVLLLLSASGRSTNLIRAAAAAKETGLHSWALTGQAPNPLASACDEHVAVLAESAPTVQECHLVAVHTICAALDDALLPDSA